MDPFQPCPCKSGDGYGHCCRPFHLGTLPETPLQLMRSRFSAYALCLADYILHTTHPHNKTPQDRKQIIAFSKHTEFRDLKILDAHQEGERGTVTFFAHLIQQGQDVSFTEKSLFEKHAGKWLYLSGEMLKR